MGVQEELDDLKAEKKAISQNLKIADGCLEEYKRFSMLDYSKTEDEIRHFVEVPEYPYELPEEKHVVTGEVPETEQIVLPVEDYVADSTVEVNQLGMALSADVVEDATKEEKTSEKKQLSYEEYKKLTPLEKAKNVNFGQLKSHHSVQLLVRIMFEERGYAATADEILEEGEQLYKGMCEVFARDKAQEVFEKTKQIGIPWEYWSVSEKAEALGFELDNNSYNIRLYNEVCKLCGVDTSDEDKVFKDYQEIYDKTVDMQSEKIYERRDGGRGRAR